MERTQTENSQTATSEERERRRRELGDGLLRLVCNGELSAEQATAWYNSQLAEWEGGSEEAEGAL